MPPPLKTILIDDEKLAIKRLRRLLEKHNDVFDIVGEAYNGEEGQLMVTTLHPEVIFLDIEMPGLNGFEMLNRLSDLPIVIFVTAFETYAIRAFEENSVDYLLKPVEPERLAITVEKIKKLSQQHSSQEFPPQLWQLIEQMKPKKELFSIPVKVGDRILFIRPEETEYFEAEDKYVYLYTTEGKRHLIDYTLTILEEKLPDYFVRISRSVIVNRKCIREIQRYLGGRYAFILQGKEPIKLISGASYAEKVKALWEI